LGYAGVQYCDAVSGQTDWFAGTLSTIGDICRAVSDESIRNTITWLIDQIGIDCNKNIQKLLKQLKLT
jgi:hypothetical protein